MSSLVYIFFLFTDDITSVILKRGFKCAQGFFIFIKPPYFELRNLPVSRFLEEGKAPKHRLHHWHTVSLAHYTAQGHFKNTNYHDRFHNSLFLFWVQSGIEGKGTLQLQAIQRTERLDLQNPTDEQVYLSSDPTGECVRFSPINDANYFCRYLIDKHTTPFVSAATTYVCANSVLSPFVPGTEPESTFYSRRVVDVIGPIADKYDDKNVYTEFLSDCAYTCELKVRLIQNASDIIQLQMLHCLSNPR